MAEPPAPVEMVTVEEIEESVLSLRPSKMSITVPEDDDRMLLTEDQVQSLCRGGKDSSFDWSLALGGAAVGLAQNAITVLHAIYNHATPSMLDTLLAGVCLLCLAGAAAKFTEHRRTSTSIDTMLQKLKAGRKVRL